MAFSVSFLSQWLGHSAFTFIHGVVGWGLAEMPSYFGFYDEIWLKPFEYPVTTLIATGLYVAGLVYLASPPGRTPRPGEPEAAVA